MQQFKPKESKTAKATMRNPTAKTFDYVGRLYMGTELAVMVEVPFSLSSGQAKEVFFPVTMPSVLGTYPVYIGVFSGGKNVALYRAVDDVAIVGVTFTCPYCKATMSAPDEVIGLADLVSHQQTCAVRLAIIAAGKDAPIMYTCPHCDWVGYYEWDFWRHKWYHRPDIPKPEKYACHYCQSIFGTASELMAHIRSAHGLPAPTPTPADAAFYLWDLSASGAIVGRESTISIRVINYGGDTGEYSITATIDGQTSTATGKLTPAEQGSAQFKFTPTRAGTHTITANGFTGSFEVQQPPGTITMFVSCPGSAKGGSTVQAVVTYVVAPYVEWAKLTVISYAGGAREFPLSTAPGSYSVPVSVFQPSDGYLYQRVTFQIDYGVYYAWSAFAGPVEAHIYLTLA